MVEVSFCSVRWHYLCRQRDCHSPWAVLWSLARLQAVNQKGILNISAASGCLFSPLVFVLFYFLLSISSDFQTHREVLRSKPAVISFSTDKIRLIGTGLCFWGKEKTVLEYVHEEEGNGELFWNLSLLAKKGMSNLPGLFTQGYRTAAMQALSRQRSEGSVSWLVFLSWSLRSAGAFWVDCCCFSGLLSEQSKAQGVSVKVILAGTDCPKFTRCRVSCPHFFWSQTDLISHIFSWFNFFRGDWLSRAVCLYRCRGVNKRKYLKWRKRNNFIPNSKLLLWIFLLCNNIAFTAKFCLISKVDITSLFSVVSWGHGNVTSVRPAPGTAVLAAKSFWHQSHKHCPSMGCCLWHSSSGPFYTVEQARHWLHSLLDPCQS